MAKFNLKAVLTISKHELIKVETRRVSSFHTEATLTNSGVYESLVL